MLSSCYLLIIMAKIMHALIIIHCHGLMLFVLNVWYLTYLVTSSSIVLTSMNLYVFMINSDFLIDVGHLLSLFFLGQITTWETSIFFKHCDLIVFWYKVGCLPLSMFTVWLVTFLLVRFCKVMPCSGGKNFVGPW